MTINIEEPIYMFSGRDAEEGKPFSDSRHLLPLLAFGYRASAANF